MLWNVFHSGVFCFKPNFNLQFIVYFRLEVNTIQGDIFLLLLIKSGKGEEVWIMKNI